jgi:hypothetical protein
LALAVKEHSRLKLSTGPDEFPFYSRILEVHETMIYIDDPQPTRIEEELLVDSPIDLVFPLTARVYFHGKSVFNGLKATLSEPLVYMIAKPESLTYLKERRVPRVTPTAGLPAVCLAIGGQPAAAGVQIQNIGLEGACLTLAQRADHQEGDKFPTVKLKLAGSVYLTLDAAVRYAIVDDLGRYCVGLMWEPLTKPQYLALRNYVRLVQESGASKLAG